MEIIKWPEVFTKTTVKPLKGIGKLGWRVRQAALSAHTPRTLSWRAGGQSDRADMEGCWNPGAPPHSSPLRQQIRGLLTNQAENFPCDFKSTNSQ